MTVTDAPTDIADRAAAVAEVAAVHAADVDRQARFPVETMNALRDARLLSVMIPAEFGGGGSSVRDAAAAVTAIGRKCSSSALIYAMHLSQVACLSRHATEPSVQDALRRIAEQQLLVASATTEIGSGGDVRTSTCYVDRDGSRFQLKKQAPVISYGRHSDIILVTARRDADSAPHDQVLVICPTAETNLEETVPWDTLGFRGTCSNGYLLTAEGDVEQVMSTPYAEISSQTMLPISHLVWTAAWLGMAEEAVDRARRFVQAAARSKPGTTPPGALRLAELYAVHQQMRDLLDSALRRFDAIAEDRDAFSGAGTTVALNSLKVAASNLLVDIVNRAMVICGISGYREDSPYSLGRILRDAHGAQLMVNNDRISGNNAQLLLIAKDA
jgi:acyl-CoA dehydrogenase